MRAWKRTKKILANNQLFRQGSFVNGQWLPGKGKTYPVLNPATGERVADVADHGATETRLAIGAAHDALLSWKALSAKERSVLLRRWHDLILEHREDLAVLLTAEQGKVLEEARAEISYGAAYIEWFAEEAKRVYGDIIPAPSTNKRVLVLKQPVGVVAAITPWNFPNAMITRKVAPALAAGCTVVLKPAEETPLSALALAYLAEEAGIPQGVFNVVCGLNAPAMGAELTGNSHVRKVTFTGSTPVGKILLAQSAQSVKKVSMELGGNAPLIVFDDADLDLAIEGVMLSKFRNAGQTCVCSNRLLVQAGIYETFMEHLVTAVNALVLGDGSDPATNIGPLVNPAAVDSVAQKVREAVSAGAQVVAGGSTSDLGACFYQPTVLGNVSSDMRIVTQEIFGPVAPVQQFTSEEEAISMANNTESGLAAYCYTSDMSRIWRLTDQLEYGMVGINDGAISNEMAPFGGIKESGLGREGSKYGLDDYLEIKYVSLGGL